MACTLCATCATDATADGCTDEGYPGVRRKLLLGVQPAEQLHSVVRRFGSYEHLQHHSRCTRLFAPVAETSTCSLHALDLDQAFTPKADVHLRLQASLGNMSDLTVSIQISA